MTSVGVRVSNSRWIIARSIAGDRSEREEERPVCRLQHRKVRPGLLKFRTRARDEAQKAGPEVIDRRWNVALPIRLFE
jgi:hypothetical protein